MHVTSILTFGLVFMLWSMGLSDEDNHYERLMERVQEGDGTASQSASDSWRGNPVDKKWIHLNALEDKNGDQPGKRKMPSEEAGVWHNENRRVYRLFRQFVNSLTDLVKEKVKEKYEESIGWTNDFEVGIRLDSEKLRVIEKFGTDEHFNLDSLYNAHEAMNRMLQYVNFPQHESKSWIENFLGCTPRQAAIFLLGFLFMLKVPELLLYILSDFRLSWRWLILLVFLVSFGWKDYEMYLVVVETVSECLWIPLQTAGEPIAKFVQNLCGGLPVYLYPVAGVVALIMVLLMYTLITGCQLRLLFGIIHIGARPSVIEGHGERAELEALRIEVATLRQEKALLQSQREAIEMNAGGDARPANRLQGVPPQKAIKGARHKKGKEHMAKGPHKTAQTIMAQETTCGCHLDTESASSEESDDGSENQASRTSGMNCTRPFTVTRSFDNEDLCE